MKGIDEESVRSSVKENQFNKVHKTIVEGVDEDEEEDDGYNRSTIMDATKI